jgi:predicted dinucleotide-binding enzyme
VTLYCRFCLTSGQRCEAVSVVHGGAVCVRHLAALVSDPVHSESDIVRLVMGALRGDRGDPRARKDAELGPQDSRSEPDEHRPQRRLVAVLGASRVAVVLTHHLLAAGHRVNVWGTSPPQWEPAGGGSTSSAAAGFPTVADAVTPVQVAIIAVPFPQHRELPPGPFAGKVTVDAMNYDPATDPAAPELDTGGTTSSELVARHFAEARLVKALNTEGFLAPGRLGPFSDVSPVAVPIAGDDAAAKAIVSAIVVDMGFDPVDVGGLADSWRFQPGTRLFGLTSDADSLRRMLEYA